MVECKFLEEQPCAKVQSRKPELSVVISWIDVAILELGEWSNEFGKSLKSDLTTTIIGRYQAQRIT